MWFGVRMARKPRALIAGGIYHVTSRGNERRAIFKDDRDRERFLQRLAESAETHQVRVYLYCLMTNHIHLLVETPMGNLSRFMGSLLTGYTVYYNRRHRRAGHLMQGRYGAQVVEGNEYLLKLSRYIHLNPVQIKPVKSQPLPDRLRALRSYVWSSFGEYSGRAKSGGWLKTEPILHLMGEAIGRQGGKAYGGYVEAGLAKKDEEFEGLMKGRGVAIGSETFVEEVKRLHQREAKKRLKPEDVSFRQLRDWKTVEGVQAIIKEVVGDQWELRKHRKAGRSVRGLYAWALQQHAGLTQREVARHLEVGTGSAVCRMINETLGANPVAQWLKSVESLIKG